MGMMDRPGGQCVWASEIDYDARQTYRLWQKNRENVLTADAYRYLTENGRRRTAVPAPSRGRVAYEGFRASQ